MIVKDMKFGNLIVIRENKPFLLCKCVCGKLINVESEYLNNGTIQSCGVCKVTNKMVNRLGYRYGKLTVIKLSGKKNDCPIWLCKCDCGKTKEVSSKNLRKEGGVRSCGCLIKETRPGSKAVLPNKRYGKLVAIKPLEVNSHKNWIWLCKCDCGKEVKILSCNLQSNNTRSCGCSRKTYDITGLKFGKLVAVRISGKRHGQILWFCVCDCGGTKEVVSGSLRSLRTKSCGCLLRGAKRETDV